MSTRSKALKLTRSTRSHANLSASKVHTAGPPQNRRQLPNLGRNRPSEVLLHFSGNLTNQASGSQPLNTSALIEAIGEISPTGVRRRRMDGFLVPGTIFSD